MPDFEFLTPDQASAISALVAIDAHAWYDQATAFTCPEADAIRDFLLAFVGEYAATAFIDAHALGDEEDDAHFATPDETIVQLTEEGR